MPSRTGEGIQAFFRRVDAITSKLNLIGPEEEEPRTEKDEQVDLCRALVSTREFQEGLLPMLQERMQQIDEIMPSLLHSHPDLCAYQGRKDEVRELIKQFHEWSQGE